MTPPRISPGRRRRRRLVVAPLLLIVVVTLRLAPGAECSGLRSFPSLEDVIFRRRALKGKAARCVRKARRGARGYIKCAWPLTRPDTAAGKKGGRRSEKKARKKRIQKCGGTVPSVGASANKNKKCVSGTVSPDTMDMVVGLCRAGGMSRASCNTFGFEFVDMAAMSTVETETTQPAKTTTTTTTTPAETDTVPQGLVGGRMSYVPWKVKDFDPDIVDGITNCTSFVDQLYEAFKMQADLVIRQNVDSWNRHKRYKGDVMFDEPVAVENAQPEGADDGEEVVDEDSYDTNNQEDGVQEGDIVKANDKIVFAGYGNLLLCWDAVTGDMVARVRFEATEKLDKEPKGNWHNQVNNKATILSLLLDGDRLAVAVDTGYRGWWCRFCRYPLAEDKKQGDSAPNEQALLSDHGAVKVYVYNISDDAIPGADILRNKEADDEEMELPLLFVSELQGYPMSYRAIGGAVHIVTGQEVRNWLFTEHLQRWHKDYEGMNVTEYANASAARAEELAPRFARKLAEEVVGRGGGCDGDGSINIMGISSFGMASSSDQAANDGGAGVKFLGTNGILNRFVRVNSFDMSQPSVTVDTEEAPPLNVSVGGCFMPTWSAETYASQSVLVLSGRLQSRVGGPWPFWTWEEYTYLLAFRLSTDGSAARGMAVGTVPGYSINRFAFDEFKGYLRVATTISEKTECAKWTNHTVEYCVEWKGGDCLSYANHTHTWCDWGSWVTSSNSTSLITVLKLPMNETEAEESGGLMTFVANVTDLGVTETIHSCRFMDDRAFVVTFRLTDPLYSIDFSDPRNPKLADELKITGFGRYLHLVGDWLLSVGQDADPRTGRATGLAISLFDVGDIHNISLLTRYSVETSNTSYSSSAAEFDPHAFRMLPKSMLLLLPVRVRDWDNRSNNVNGFVFFHIASDAITERFTVNIEDTTAYANRCCYYARMPPRTLVFKGNATLIKDNHYQSWDLDDLDTREPRWNKTLDVHLKKEDCSKCWWDIRDIPF